MEWSIQGRSHQCQACGRGFRSKETLHTLLRDEQNAYVRMDVCAACWQAHYAEGANHQRGFVSCWKSYYRPPSPPPPEPIQRETAETLLRKLVEREAPEHAAACFILAVMLERKRLLKVRSQTTEGDRRVLVYEHPKTGDVFTILDPRLQLDQLEAVQRDVARLLEHGPDAPPASGPDAAATPGAAAPASEAPSAETTGAAPAKQGTDEPAEPELSTSTAADPDRGTDQATEPAPASGASDLPPEPIASHHG